MSYLELLITLSAFVLALFAFKDFPAEWLLIQNLRQGKPLPKRIQDFPVHETSLESYFDSRSKIESFLEEVENKIPSILIVSESDINNINLKGLRIDKHELKFSGGYVVENEFFDFEILDNRIIMNRIKYPQLFKYKGGILTEKTLIWYEEEESRVLEMTRLVEVNSNDTTRIGNGDYDFLWEISGMYYKKDEIQFSSFLFYLFGAVESLNHIPENRSNNIFFERVRIVLSEVRSIRIFNDELVISTFK
jgi:hypothetical protein